MTATHPAARAWALMTRPDDPMPVGPAVDWLREQMGTDDLRAVFLAACGAASAWMHELFQHSSTLWSVTPAEIQDRVRCGFFTHQGVGGFIDPLGEMRRLITESMRREEALTWLPWLDRTDSTLALCREIETITCS